VEIEILEEIFIALIVADARRLMCGMVLKVNACARQIFQPNRTQ
jgi:hypothetical protein